jgi:hypothetical protein
MRLLHLIAASSLSGCIIPESWTLAAHDVDRDGHVAVVFGGDDCDDANARAYEGAVELCSTGRDEDCDGEVDEAGVGAVTVWLDTDGDGFGDPNRQLTTCKASPQYALRAGDCDDGVRDVHPGARELCNDRDDDCDLAIDEGAPPTTWYPDVDADGFGDPTRPTSACLPPADGWLALGADCDDAVAAVNPAAADVPYDGLDADCDGASDFDVDGDGWDFPTDCDDADRDIHPAAAEVPYDDVDDDCAPGNEHDLDRDGVTGPAWPLGADCDDRSPLIAGPSVYYPDVDGDTYGDPAGAVVACQPPPGHVLQAGDCDDRAASVNPIAIETCDGADQDCDGAIDEGAGEAWYPDRDRDGRGDTLAFSVRSCGLPADPTVPAWSLTPDDCDDTRGDVYTGAPERCDLTDNDCDTLIDEGVTPTWHRDDDADGVGTAESAFACAPPADWLGAVRGGPTGDCDDARADVFPGATEVCDLTDQDCDGLIDEGVTPTWHRDDDADDLRHRRGRRRLRAPGPLARLAHLPHRDRLRRRPRRRLPRRHRGLRPHRSRLRQPRRRRRHAHLAPRRRRRRLRHRRGRRRLRSPRPLDRLAHVPHNAGLRRRPRRRLPRRHRGLRPHRSGLRRPRRRRRHPHLAPRRRRRHLRHRRARRRLPTPAPLVRLAHQLHHRRLRRRPRRRLPRRHRGLRPRRPRLRRPHRRRRHPHLAPRRRPRRLRHRPVLHHLRRPRRLGRRHRGPHRHRLRRRQPRPPPRRRGGLQRPRRQLRRRLGGHPPGDLRGGRCSGGRDRWVPVRAPKHTRELGGGRGVVQPARLPLDLARGSRSLEPARRSLVRRVDGVGDSTRRVGPSNRI